MTELILVRHGKTQANSDGRYCGRLDLPLVQEGLEDVRHTAKMLSKYHPCRVYCSDALRARQTADYLAPGGDIKVRREIRELDFGAFEGLRADEIESRMPEEWQAYLDDYMNYTFPGGDHVRSYLTSAAQIIDALVRESEADRVLVVTHKGFILASLSYLLHGGIAHAFSYDIRPAGFARLSVCEGFAVLKQLV